MTVDLGGGYLSGLTDDQRDELTRVNAPGLTALREYLASGKAVAFLGAGVSRPLYPLWDGLIGELVDAAADRLTPKEQATCRALAHDSPEAVVEMLAGVSLFTRPVTAAAVLAVAAHEAFGGRLAGWTPGMVQAAVRDRLTGLATWHPDATITAHPLVRDTFRPLALPAAASAADTSLTGLPRGKVTSRADARRVTEAIELLIDAGQWQPADDLYTSRCDNGHVWLNLPAARLGQRTAAAFAATPARRDACATHLNSDRLGFYLNEVGLSTIYAGDLTTARDYLTLAARHARDTGDMHNLGNGLLNLAGCLGRLGLAGPAREAAAEALTRATAADDRENVGDAHVYLGWLAALAGDTTAAEDHFATADQIRRTDDPDGDHLYSLPGIWWTQWLARTGRTGPARDLTGRNAEISRENGWNADLARCDQTLGGLALATGDTVTADTYLTAAVAAFRDGDHLTDLADALPGLAACAQAACAQATGDLDTAERYASEASSIASPRGLIPALCAALTARALIRVGQSAAEGTNPDHLAQGRDAANAALRLATRHELARHEFDALRAHAELDQAEGLNQGWAAKADALHNLLVPPGLDPDPLATVERLVPEQKAADEANEGDD